MIAQTFRQNDIFEYAIIYSINSVLQITNMITVSIVMSLVLEIMMQYELYQKDAQT